MRGRPCCVPGDLEGAVAVDGGVEFCLVVEEFGAVGGEHGVVVFGYLAGFGLVAEVEAGAAHVVDDGVDHDADHVAGGDLAADGREAVVLTVVVAAVEVVALAPAGEVAV